MAENDRLFDDDGNPNDVDLKYNAPKENSDAKRLRFNICGAKYEILESTFQRYPATLLANREKREEFWDPVRNEFFLDRNRACFKSVLTYYQSHGIIVCPNSVPETLFTQELEFYNIHRKKPKHRPMPENKFQKKVWELFEYADTSNGARVIAWLSCTVVLLSIIIFCLETVPEFEKDDDNDGGRQHVKSKQETIFFLLEAACIAWFSLEYLIRFISSPHKCKFVVKALNVIDVVAILPFFVAFAVENQNSSVSSLAVLRAVRLVRVFRIFKLSRYSKGMQILGLTLKASLAELGLLSFFLAIGVVLFSSAAYFAEMDENKEVFRSIPHSFWWAIVTMTTVGYGDMFPITFWGKLVGSLCAFSGILVIALPVPVIVANFQHFYGQRENGEASSERTTRVSNYGKLRKLFKNLRRGKPDIAMQEIIQADGKEKYAENMQEMPDEKNANFKKI